MDRFSPLDIAVLTVSDTRTIASDTSGSLLVERLEAAGHRIAGRELVADDQEAISDLLSRWTTEGSIDVVIVTGGTGVTARDVTPEAMSRWVTKPLPGFGELFRRLSYDEIGPAAIQSRAEAAWCHNALVFLLPGSTGAVRLALERILLPQLDSRTRPCNFALLLSRARGADEAPR